MSDTSTHEPMTEDQMEAESWRYSRAFFVVPLSSGRIAVLDFKRNVRAYADDWQAAKGLGEKLYQETWVNRL